jgi:hypothetical protein
MIQEFFEIKKISEDKQKMKYIIKTKYTPLLIPPLFIVLFIILIVYSNILIALLVTPLLAILLVVLLYYPIMLAKIKGRRLVYRAIDYKQQELTIYKGNDRGFLKYTIEYDMSALKGNTKGLSYSEKVFTDTASKIFRIK